MRVWLAAAVVAIASQAWAEEAGHGSLEFSRLTKPQEQFFWRRVKSLAVEEAALAYCGEADDFALRATQGVRACVTAAALEQAQSVFKAEMKKAAESLAARKPSCRAAPKPNRGWLGVELAASSAEGAEVAGTVADSPAAGAGLKAGDVISAVNGDAVAGPKELSARIRALAPGAAVRLEVKHDGAAREASVKLGAMAFDADGSVALDMPALVAESREDLKRVADEVTDLCAKCKTTVWALFCR
jgi:predicted metalloprotease with PDZ domain